MVQEGKSVDAEAAEEIMGQYLFALGAGAGGQWIERRAIRVLRRHYLPSIQKAVSSGASWERDAVWILHYVNVIGRLAAQRAIDDGHDSINPENLRLAIAAVEANYADKPSPDSPTSEGVWCNPPGG
jgi:hypothetical protein